MALDSNSDDKRHHKRYQCKLPIEIRTPTQAFPSKTDTTDVSLGGCYVASIYTYPIGASLEIKLWVGDVAVETVAVVETADPGVGNGLKFGTLDAKASAALEQYLSHFGATTPPPDPNDMLSQLIR